MYIISQWPKLTPWFVFVSERSVVGSLQAAELCIKLQFYTILYNLCRRLYVSCLASMETVRKCGNILWLMMHAGNFNAFKMNLFFSCTTYTLFQRTLWEVLYIQFSYFFKSLGYITLGFGQFFGPCIVDIEHKVTNRCMYNCRSNRCTDISPADVYLSVQKMYSCVV